MTFEFMKWRPSFEEYRRGVKRGDLAFKRPRPFFDLSSKTEWFKFVVWLFGGLPLGVICGAMAYFATGGLGLTIAAWIYLLIGGWFLFWILHLVHSLYFLNIAKLTNVEFVSLDKAAGIGKRIFTMPGELTATDYNILYSRFIWADVECEPYRDVTDWVERIRMVQMGGPEVTASSIGEGIGAAIGMKYQESKIKEIVDTAGGIPSPREIIKILQTELIPRYRELLGERLAMLYLLFLGTQPPILPYDKSTSKSEMRAVASVSDTKEVLDYLKPLSEKMEV